MILNNLFRINTQRQSAPLPAPINLSPMSYEVFVPFVAKEHSS